MTLDRREGAEGLKIDHEEIVDGQPQKSTLVLHDTRRGGWEA
jgi:hypothetical protein